MLLKEFLESKDYKKATFMLAYGVDGKVLDILDERFQNLQIMELSGLDLGCISVRLPVAQTVPDGYEVIQGAMTAPKGYTWYYNGVPMLELQPDGSNKASRKRTTIIVKDKKK